MRNTIYRPKQTVLYVYGTTQKAYIACHPQSRWKLAHKSDCKVELMNKNITICLKPKDFERSWVKVKEKEMRE